MVVSIPTSYHLTVHFEPPQHKRAQAQQPARAGRAGRKKTARAVLHTRPRAPRGDHERATMDVERGKQGALVWVGGGHACRYAL